MGLGRGGARARARARARAGARARGRGTAGAPPRMRKPAKPYAIVSCAQAGTRRLRCARLARHSRRAARRSERERRHCDGDRHGRRAGGGWQAVGGWRRLLLPRGDVHLRLLLRHGRSSCLRAQLLERLLAAAQRLRIGRLPRWPEALAGGAGRILVSCLRDGPS